jgi:uncharacterized protein YjeT (DUF2065 family)
MSGVGLADLVTAIGLVFVIEGVLLALVPGMLRRAIESMVSQPVDHLRLGGVASAMIGLFIVWLARG